MALPQVDILRKDNLSAYLEEERTQVNKQIKIKGGSFYLLAVSSWLLTLFILASLFHLI